MATVAFSNTLSPLQTDNEPVNVIFAVGSGLTIIFALSGNEVQPLASTPVK